jgi:riboflavin transporter FmnP
MVHRGIATLSGALMVCFFLLAHYEPQFFLLHFYQALMYLAIILLLFYFEDHWAYAIGIQVPLVWLALVFGTGLLGGAMQQGLRFLRGEGVTNKTGPMALVIAAVGLVMAVNCILRWRREISGLRIARPTFAISAAIVLAYYSVLITLFWHTVPSSQTAP